MPSKSFVKSTWTWGSPVLMCCGPELKIYFWWRSLRAWMRLWTLGGGEQSSPEKLEVSNEIFEWSDHPFSRTCMLKILPDLRRNWQCRYIRDRGSTAFITGEDWKVLSLIRSKPLEYRRIWAFLPYRLRLDAFPQSFTRCEERKFQNYLSFVLKVWWIRKIHHNFHWRVFEAKTIQWKFEKWERDGIPCYKKSWIKMELFCVNGTLQFIYFAFD